VRDIVVALKVRLAPLGYPVHYVEVPGAPTYPYLLLWSTTGRMAAHTLAGRRDFLDDTLGVTGVALSADGVLTVQKRQRALLDGHRLDADGWLMDELRLKDAQQVQVDRDVEIPGAGYPKYGVDLYAISGRRAP
jgi:hypothetical protein